MGLDRIARLRLCFRDEEIQELRREVGIRLPAWQREAALDGIFDFGRSRNLYAVSQRRLGSVLRGGRGQAADERGEREERTPQAAVTARRMR